MPVLSHLVGGKVYDLNGTLLSGATVTLTHPTITPSISVNSNALGEYVINLSGLSSQWSIGDTFTITASKTAEGTISTTTVISSGGGQVINLTLAETSALTYYAQPLDRYNLNFVLLTHYDGEKVTRERPLPVSSSGIDLLYNPSTSWAITRGDGQPDSETVVIKGVSYKRTFTYTNDILTARSEWVRQ